jgi:hypothetical protein
MSARFLLAPLALVVHSAVSVALAMNRRGFHSGWLGVAARFLTLVCRRLYDVEAVREARR